MDLRNKLELSAIQHGIYSGAAFKHKRTGKKVFVSSLAICESDLSVMVLYIEKSGVIWVRPLKEFIDGRFEKITDD
jgi:hypothetical protein